MTCRERARSFAQEAILCWREGNEALAHQLIQSAIREWRKSHDAHKEEEGQ